MRSSVQVDDPVALPREIACGTYWLEDGGPQGWSKCFGEYKNQTLFRQQEIDPFVSQPLTR